MAVKDNYTRDIQFVSPLDLAPAHIKRTASEITPNLGTADRGSWPKGSKRGSEKGQEVWRQG
eukprot:3080323-Karenia_brevis.AAC.1